MLKAGFAEIDITPPVGTCKIGWIIKLVNHTCHPPHHGGDAVLSAGYPCVLAASMKPQGCPVTLFLNGACGNVVHPTWLPGQDARLRAMDA